MTRLHAIGDTLKRQERLLDVVFVHGAGGHYLNSWGRRREEFGGDRDSMLHWLLTEESLSDIGVWSLEHESDKFWGGSQGSMERPELVRNLLVEIGQTATFMKSSPEQPRRPICWIAHSEGGNVVKSLLKYCQEERGGTLERAKVAGGILDATQSVYFIDTPHRGSWVARFTVLGLREALGLRKRVRELREADPMLTALDTWYVDNMDRKVRSLNFYQSGERYKVVGTASVMLNRADNFAIDRNHNKIATPESRAEDPYRGIHLDLQRIHAEIRLQLSLVPAAPLQLQRDEVVFDGEPLRLLCFVEPELGAFDPSAPGRGQSKTFRVKFWLSQRDSPPARLEESWIEGVSAEHLADSITGVYCDQLNECPDGRLLLALFLPQQDLVADGLPQFLQQLRHSARGSLPNSTGIPLLLACSSRWAVGSSAHPRLSKTRSDLRKASIQLHHTLGKANLGCLNWLMIDPSIDLPPGSHRSPRPCTISSVATDSAVFQDHGFDADDAIDPLANRNAIYLSNGVRNRSTQGDLNPMDPLLMRGIPLIWCEKQLAPAGDQSETAEAPSSHPMDSILAWDGLTFLSRFYRYQQEKPGEADQPNLPLRRFIRDGIIFWEDHRHIPTEATSPRSDSPASANPFTVPFHPNHP